MAKGFINPQSDFAAIVRRGAATEWAQRAIALAIAAGQSLDSASLNHWLDQAEPADTQALRATNPELDQERHSEAAAAAQNIALAQGIWSPPFGAEQHD